MPEIMVPSQDQEKQIGPSLERGGLVISGLLTESSFVQNGFHGGPTRKRKLYQIILWSWYAAFVDLLVVTSISLVSLMLVGIVLKYGLVKFPISFRYIFIPFYIASYYTYQLSTRYYMGVTLGEWSCDLKLAFLSKTKVKYLFRLIFRETILLFSGIFLLPILSFVFQIDLLGKISGLYIFSKK